MIKPSFFQTTAVREALARAARAAATPIAAHPVSETGEGPRITGQGQCAACRFVNRFPQGAAACRASRAKAVAMAARRRKPVPFTCHLGFSCVAMAALPGVKDSPYVLTFGPYCPAEAAEALDVDVQAGLVKLKLDENGLPFTLDDVARVPASVAPAVAEWTAESLLELARAEEASEEEPEEAELDADASRDKGPQRRRPARRPPNASVAAVWAALAASGDRAALRRAAENVLAEAGASLDAWRGRAVELAGEATRQAAESGADLSHWWTELPEHLAALRAAERPGDVISAALRMLGGVEKPAPRRSPVDPFLKALQDAVRQRLPEAAPLEEIAKALGLRAATVSQRLSRAAGLSYPEFVNRQRVEKAKELLRRTRLGVEEIAVRVGVNGASYLSRLFTRFEGVPPGEYRRRFGKDS